MFAAGIFADDIFADVNAPGGAGGRGLIGGSGFPPNWLALLAANAAEADRERRRLEEEIAVLRLAGAL